jgi:hypothetical protein
MVCGFPERKERMESTGSKLENRKRISGFQAEEQLDVSFYHVRVTLAVCPESILWAA